MRKLLSLVVALLFAVSTLALIGCDEEAEDWDEDTDSETVPEPEPNTDIPPGPEASDSDEYYKDDPTSKAKVSRGF